MTGGGTLLITVKWTGKYFIYFFLAGFVSDVCIINSGCLLLDSWLVGLPDDLTTTSMLKYFSLSTTKKWHWYFAYKCDRIDIFIWFGHVVNGELRDGVRIALTSRFCHTYSAVAFGFYRKAIFVREK